MKSMTGYSWHEELCNNAMVSIEIKSYNSRYLELSVNQPFWLSRLEPKIREFVSSKVQRGKIEISVRIKEHNSSVQVIPDIQLAKAYADAFNIIAKELKYKKRIPISVLLNQEGLLKTERDMDADKYWELVLPILEMSFKQFEASRIAEGNALKQDIENMVFILEKSSQIFVSYMKTMEDRLRSNIQERFTELLNGQYDEQRVMQETAALLLKYTINEEIVRLDSHLKSLRNEISENPSPGKRLDFICQEINREVNTIGSKNQIIEVGQAVINAKEALENIREQIRNIE